MGLWSLVLPFVTGLCSNAFVQTTTLAALAMFWADLKKGVANVCSKLRELGLSGCLDIALDTLLKILCHPLGFCIAVVVIGVAIHNVLEWYDRLSSDTKERLDKLHAWCKDHCNTRNLKVTVAVVICAWLAWDGSNLYKAVNIALKDLPTMELRSVEFCPKKRPSINCIVDDYVQAECRASQEYVCRLTRGWNKYEWVITPFDKDCKRYTTFRDALKTKLDETVGSQKKWCSFAKDTVVAQIQTWYTDQVTKFNWKDKNPPEFHVTPPRCDDFSAWEFVNFLFWVGVLCFLVYHTWAHWNQSDSAEQPSADAANTADAAGATRGERLPCDRRLLAQHQEHLIKQVNWKKAPQQSNDSLLERYNYVWNNNTEQGQQIEQQSQRIEQQSQQIKQQSQQLEQQSQQIEEQRKEIKALEEGNTRHKATQAQQTQQVEAQGTGGESAMVTAIATLAEKLADHLRSPSHQTTPKTDKRKHTFLPTTQERATKKAKLAEDTKVKETKRPRQPEQTEDAHLTSLIGTKLRAELLFFGGPWATQNSDKYKDGYVQGTIVAVDGKNGKPIRVRWEDGDDPYYGLLTLETDKRIWWPNAPAENSSKRQQVECT